MTNWPRDCLTGAILEFSYISSLRTDLQGFQLGFTNIRKRRTRANIQTLILRSRLTVHQQEGKKVRIIGPLAPTCEPPHGTSGFLYDAIVYAPALTCMEANSKWGVINPLGGLLNGARYSQ
jgi:hypothetical protein